jgi:ATP-dependent exoDNAse (exonuclease V) beta subunit
VITAHKAKGMEFSRVFVVALTAREWEGGGKKALIPSPLETTRERAEVIRLLYVALTRAKDELVLSYAQNTNEGRETAPSTLIPPGLPTIEPVSDSLPKLHATTNASELACKLTKAYLEKDGLSPSALNEYLESPSCFFAKRVLRLREPETPALTIGNAVHAGIAAFYTAKGDADVRLDAARAAAGRSLRESLLARDAAFEAITHDVYARVEAFTHTDIATRETISIEKAYTSERTVEGCNVVLRGKIDAVLKGNGTTLVDFKTSSKASKEDREKWKTQIAFYDLLLRADGGAPESALIAQVSDEGVAEHEVPLGSAERAEFEQTLTAVLTELLTCKWRSAPANQYDAVLKLFEGN